MDTFFNVAQWHITEIDGPGWPGIHTILVENNHPEQYLEALEKLQAGG
jgi:hypothetical protein